MAGTNFAKVNHRQAIWLLAAGVREKQSFEVAGNQKTMAVKDVQKMEFFGDLTGNIVLLSWA